jgi:Ni/Fe-hydrogenase subunit HybB-like protein
MAKAKTSGHLIPDEEMQLRPAYIEGDHTFETVTGQLGDLVLKRPYNWRWFLGFAIAFTLMNALLVAVTWLFIKGVGVWGVRTPVMWGFAIVNFVWWIGIGHAGTLISAILLLLKQQWRTSINRFAEAMTLFAVACAGMFPLLHLGRPWVFYWLMPYPNTMGMWPQWRSPLVWDVFAVSTYGTVSLLFWYVGLIPDLATLRDRAKNPLAKVAYGVFALGWRGSAVHWHRYRTAYLLLAALATPLVVSVHTVVSFDFTIGIVPGWHSTIFPPYFVAGAIFSGFAMVLTLTIPLRKAFKLQEFITDRHLEVMGKVTLTTGLIVAFGYFIEAFMAWYGGNEFEMNQILEQRPHGPVSHTYWQLIFCNCLTPQLLWFRFFRTNPVALWIISIIVNIGMWLERYVIVVMSLETDFLPSSWSIYQGTVWDYATYFGTLGFFFVLLFLFIRFLPVISITEMREMVHHHDHAAHEHGAAHGTTAGGAHGTA